MSENKNNNLTAIILGALTAVIISSVCIISFKNNPTSRDSGTYIDSTNLDSVIDSLAACIDSCTAVVDSCGAYPDYYYDSVAATSVDSSYYYLEDYN